MNMPPLPDNIRYNLERAFAEAVKTYFNGELLEGALKAPDGVELPNILSFRRVVCAPTLQFGVAPKGTAEKSVREAVKAVFTQCIHSPGRRSLDIPVFAVFPFMQIGKPKGIEGVPVHIECEIAWATPGIRLPGLVLAWPD